MLRSVPVASVLALVLAASACSRDVTRPDAAGARHTNVPVPPCTISDIAGPTTVWRGDTATYTFRFGTGCTDPAAPVWTLSGSASSQILGTSGATVTVYAASSFTLTATDLVVDEYESASTSVDVRELHTVLSSAPLGIRVTWQNYPGTSSYKVYYRLNGGARTLLTTRTDTTTVDNSYTMAKFGAEYLEYDVEAWNGSSLLETATGAGTRANTTW